MDNPDKIFEKIKNASLNQEVPAFQSMDKVWSRVESKLDNKVLKKENKLWKKIAIAASFLLLFTVSYQIFLPKKDRIIKDNQVVNQAAEKTDTKTTLEKQPTVQNPSETKLFEKQNIQPVQESIVVVPASTTSDDSQNNATPAAEVVSEPQLVPEMAEKDSEADERQKSGRFRKAKAFDARSVRQDQEAKFDAQTEKKELQEVSKKTAPLMVIDGKAVTGKSSSEETLKQGLSKLDPDSVEDIIVLQEPLYIINGNHYSEQQLFGPNPTSPYHPLNQQEIETLSILQGEKAIAAYGKKGEKGVVIITTKNGKPVKNPVRREP